MSGRDLSVVIPCFGSGPWIHELAERLDAVLDAVGGPCEVVLVHDGSGAETWELISGLAERYERFRGIDLAERVGQHRAILCGFQEASGSLLVTMDDDLEHRPEDIPRLLAAFDTHPGVQCVIAAFPEERRSALRRAASVVMDRLYHWRYGGPPGLQMTPFRVLTRTLAQQLLERAGPDPYLPRLLLETTSAIVNVPVEHAVSRAASRYGTVDLVKLAWKGLGGPDLVRRRRRAAPPCRIRTRVGRGTTAGPIAGSGNPV